MAWHSFLFGRLSLDALPQNPIAMGGALFEVIFIIGFFFILVRFGWWKKLLGEWLTSLDHKRIGVMYIVIALVMFVRGGADMVLMRLQQALSVGDSSGIVSAAHFQELFTAHGSIMIFFVAMGIMFGIINLVLPLQIGARDVAFPLLNNISLWLFAAGALLVNISLMLGDFSAAGWLSYPPLSELKFSPGTGVDYWIWALQIGGVGSLISGINFFVTILKMRCRGMTLIRMPMFAWTVLGSMTLVIFAFPILTLTLALLALDRTLGFHFFTIDGGGNMMLYVNLIWAWGHPEVYILILPAFGIFSEIVPVFSRKKLAGYTSMVYSIAAITFFSFIVWLHHFFTMGAGAKVNAFFGIMTMIIAVPTGVKIFNWLFTMYRGSIRFPTPMLWFMGFVVCFTMGGVAGVVLSEPPADYQLHNSLFLVAHFHTMIVSGVLFGYFAGLAYWFPKIFGFMLDEKWGRRAFWLWLVGFILAFGPLYILGFMGATRRLDHYAAGLGWQPLFIVAAIGAALIVFGFATQVIQLLVSIKNRKELRVGADPWDARTLEWSVPTPPPAYNFKTLPTVYGRDAFWMQKEKGTKLQEKDEEIMLPKPSMVGLIFGALATAFGFAVVWHLWWLAALSVLVGIWVILVRTFSEETTHEMLIRP
mgnify:CR=1 FL=1|jgi:cytochrome o ubiquinol oxidase subunit 1